MSERPMADDGTGTGGLISTGGEHPDDTALLAQVVEGSEDALLTLHRRYVNLVFSLSIRILGDPMATEEVTQNVFMKVWRDPRAYNPNRGRFSSWLLTVARHASIDHLRHNGRRPKTVCTSSEKNPHTAGERMIAKIKPHPEANHDLHMLLRHLPVDQRAVIELTYFGGMSQQDIACYMGLPLGTVKTRIRLGMKHLRAMWQENR
ncbi:MAG: RNA polymerase sigma factor [Candidatus Binatia bacterium]